MIESTTDIYSEMNIMEAKLKENEGICLENFFRLELIKRQNVPKRKFPIFKMSFAETAAEISYLHNLKASMKYYVLRERVSGWPIQVSNDCSSIVGQILQFSPMRHF